MRRAWLIMLCTLIATFLLSPVARADSWALPKTEIYLSPDGSTRLTVVPRLPSSRLAYFEDRVAGRTPAGQRAGDAQASARGRLERRDAGGRWTQIWEGPLENEVAPVSVLVADGGDYVVTFDNWHSLGWGDRVVVIYDGAGRVVRSLGLRDFLPQDYVEALPRSVSSIHWGHGHRIAGDRLVLRVAIPGESIGDAPGHVELEMALATGRPVPPGGPAWENALAVAARVRAANEAGDARQRAFMSNPLTGPGTSGEGDWHLYLQEAYFRLDPTWTEGFPRVVILRAPQAPDYRQSLPWLREGLRDRDVIADALMIGSPDQENLLAVLAAEVPRLRRGALHGLRVYIAATDALWPRFADILAPTGAQLIQLDPAEPIPQRPERLRAFPGDGQTP